MPIYIGGNAPKNIYVGTTAVKKVYCGTKLVWSKEEEKGTFGKATHTYTFGNNGKGNQYYIYFEIYISSKNFIDNKMSITVDTYLGSIGNYNISASTPRTGTVYVNGTSRETQSYNATTPAGTKKRIGNNGWGNHVTPGSTAKIKASIPLHVTINDGVGKITTVNVPEFSYKVPSM